MKKFFSFTISIVSLLTGFSAISLPLVYANPPKNVMYSDAQMTNEVQHTITHYSINVNGQTYGTGNETEYIEDLPDLVAAIGDHGKEGYVYTKELLESPSTPEEAVKYQKALEKGEYTPKVLNVYKSDGITIIDTLKLDNDLFK